MNGKKRNLLLLAGVTGVVFGLTFAIPAMLQGQYLLATVGSFLLVGGLVLLALGFGEE